LLKNKKISDYPNKIEGINIPKNDDLNKIGGLCPRGILIPSLLRRTNICLLRRTNRGDRVPRGDKDPLRRLR